MSLDKKNGLSDKKDGFLGKADQSLRSPSLVDLAYDRIEAIILSGQLKGGDRLNDSQLARAFSISRGPVRGALAKLAEAGLVDHIPNRGAFVREIDLHDVLEIYEVRAAIERASAKAACTNLSDDAWRQLEACIHEMDKWYEKGDNESYFKLNLDFHYLIHQNSGNSRLMELYERYSREQRLFRHFSVVRSRMEDSHHEHKAIFKAFQKRDPEAAANAMERHVLSAKSRLVQAVKNVDPELSAV